MKENESIGHMIKFTFFSISAGLIELGSFSLFYDLFKMDYNFGYYIALVLSILWNFTLNRKYTFKSNLNVPKAMALVFLFYVFFTPISGELGDYYEGIGVNGYIVLGVTMVSNLILEFIYQKYVVYKNTINTLMPREN